MGSIMYQRLFGVVSTILLLLTGCASMAEKCLQRQQIDCAAAHAAVELERNSKCCRCRMTLGVALAKQARRDLDPTDIDMLDHRLSKAVEVLSSDQRCLRKSRFAAAAFEVRELAHSVRSDRFPPLWSEIAALNDEDDRVKAILSHARFFGLRCRHDTDAEVRRFLSYLSALSSSEIRARIPILKGTGAVGDALKMYREVLFQELVEANDPHLWMRHREDFAGTAVYSEIEHHADRAWLSRALATEDADAVERICPEIHADATRSECDLRFRELALRAAETERSAAAIGRAQRACAGKDCNRAADLMAYSFLANEAFRNVEGNSALPDLVKRSAAVWSGYIATMDTLARTMFDARSTFKRLQPHLHTAATAYVEKAKHDSRENFRQANRKWTVTRKEINSWYRPNLIFRSRWVARIDQHLGLCVEALQLDGSNTAATRLIRELITERQKLSNKSDIQIKRAKTAVKMGVDLALPHLRLPKGVKFGIQIVYAFLE